MNDDAEIYKRLNMTERILDRHDERIKTLEEIGREVKAMRLQVAGIVAVATLLVQVVFKIWK